MLPERKANANIDTDYLMAGRMLAEERGARLDNHPVDSPGISAMAKKQYDYASSHLARHYARTLESNLWFIGQHHLRIDDVSRRFVKVDSDRRIPRPVINLVLEKCESVMGILGKINLTGHVTANSNHPVDILGAKAGEKIRQAKWEMDHMDGKKRAMIQATVLGGDSFTITENDAGPESFREVTIMGEDGKPTKQRISLADTNTEVLLGIQVFANPGATTLQNARYIHIHTLQDEEFLKEAFWNVGEDFMADAEGQPIAMWQWRLRELLLNEASTSGYGSLWNRSGSTTSTRFERQTIVHQILTPPNEYYPQGRQFLVAGNATLKAGPLPLGEILMTHYRYTPVNNSFYSLGLPPGLISLNKHIESAVAQNTLSRKVAAVPMWLTPMRSGGSFTEGELRAEVGGIIKYRPGNRGEKPELVQGHHPADAGYVADMNMFIQEFLERVSGMKMVLEGDRPSGITAGIALRQLIHTASIRFAPKTDHLIETVEELETQRLKAITKAPAWVLGQYVSLPGRAGRRSFEYLRAGDLNDNFNFRIEASPKNTMDDTTMAQLTMDAWGQGMVNQQDPRNRRLALRRIGLEDAGFFDEGSVDYEHAEYVLAKLLTGDEVEIGPFDNYPILFQYVADYTKTEDYDLEDPMIKESIKRYCFELQARIQISGIGAMMQQAQLDEAASILSAPASIVEGQVANEVAAASGAPSIPGMGGGPNGGKPQGRGAGGGAMGKGGPAGGAGAMGGRGMMPGQGPMAGAA